MKLPKFRLLKAADTPAEAIEKELATLDRAVVDAETEMHRLGAARQELLLHGSDDALVAHDGAAAKVRASLEQAQARRAVLHPEWVEADGRESAERTNRARLDRYAAASKARGEGARLLAEYEKGAAALAAKLRRLAEIEAEIAEVNRDLPPDYPAVPMAEAFNGRERVADQWPEVVEWVDRDGNSRGVAEPGQAQPAPGYTRRTRYAYTPIPGAPGFPHRPLSTRVALPALDPNGTPFWAPGAVASPLSAEARAFLLQRGVSA